MAIYLVHNESDIPNHFIEQGEFLTQLDLDEASYNTDDIVIQWGEGYITTENSNGWILNSAEALKNCSESEWKEILLMNGIKVAQDTQTFQKKYLVYVFQLEILGIYSEKSDVWLSSATKSKRRFREIPLDLNRVELRNVKKLAHRTIHSLGLDFGMVLIGVNYKEQYVIQVSPKPKMFTKMAVKFVHAIRSLEKRLQMTSSPSQAMLGADPELVLRRKNGNFVLASTFFAKYGGVGCDQIWLRGDKTKTKLPIVELRPVPSTEPSTLFRNIYQRLLTASKQINDPNIQFLAGSHPLKGYPIGGHIHFSNVDRNSFLLRALDNYLTLPLFILEDPAGFTRRPKYGFIGDFREQPHGGFEYRTPPSWLVSPRITKGVLALAKLIAQSYPNLRKTPFTRKAVQMAYYYGDQDALYDLALLLWEDLEKQPLYSTYKSYLDPFKQNLVNKVRWLETSDIRPRWRIPPYN